MQHTAILGKTGSGKTFAAKGLVEHLLHDGRQVCVVDPTSAWWGLRLGADGKPAGGHKIILLGGEHGDIPLAPTTGEAVAKLVTEQRASVVIDTGRMTVGEYTRWFISFAGTLYTTIKSPLHLVIDEAHYFMPQGKVPDPEAGKMLHAGNRLMSGGRSRGIKGLLITQRPAKLHKDALTCADTLIAMRVIAPQDRNAIKEWVDGCGNAADGKRVLDSLAQLEKGEGWVWSPEIGYLERVKFPRIKTYDSSATPTGDGKAAPAVGEIDLSAVQAAMADAVREAEANDPKKLKARIAELERTGKSQLGPAVVDPRVVERAVAERDRFWRGELNKQTQAVAKLSGRINKIAALAHVNGDVPAVSAPPAIQRVTAQPVAHAPISRPAPLAPPAEGLTATQQRILDSIALMESIGVEEPSTAAVGLIAGIDPTGGYFSNTVGPLGSAGLVERGQGTIRLTEIGCASARMPETTPTLEDYHALLRKVLAKKGAATARIFDALVQNGNQEIATAALGELVNIDATGGYFSNTIGPLGTLGLIDRRQGRIIPTALMFPESLA